MTKGVDNFPKSMVVTLQLMTDYKDPARAQCIKENGEGLALVQEGKLMKAKDIK